MSTETPTPQIAPGAGLAGASIHLGRYKLVREIGRGASATVYEALDTRMERPVAVKVLTFDPTLPADRRRAQIERFQREVRAVARLSHPNIVSVYDVGEDNGRHFLVMELLSGTNLRERIEAGGPLALDEAAAVLTQIASALDATHAQHIVHRDIKPSNVILLPDGRIKMVDFGIARRGEDTTVTHSGVLIGSPAYMSPEQGRGEPASPASDIWSLGVLLYEMLAGVAPFAATHIAAVLYKSAYEQPIPLTGEAVHLQPVIERALSKSPGDRFPTAGALADAVRAVLPRESPTVVTGVVEEPSSLRPFHEAAATALNLSPANATGGRTSRPERTRRLLTDIGVVAAWATLGIGALAIVGIRVQQNSTVSAPPAARISPASAAAAHPGVPVVSTSPIPGPLPSATAVSVTATPSVPPQPMVAPTRISIVERKPVQKLAPVLALHEPAVKVAKTVAVAHPMTHPQTAVAKAPLRRQHRINRPLVVSVRQNRRPHAVLISAPERQVRSPRSHPMSPIYQPAFLASDPKPAHMGEHRAALERMRRSSEASVRTYAPQDWSAHRAENPRVALRPHK